MSPQPTEELRAHRQPLVLLFGGDYLSVQSSTPLLLLDKVKHSKAAPRFSKLGPMSDSAPVTTINKTPRPAQNIVPPPSCFQQFNPFQMRPVDRSCWTLTASKTPIQRSDSLPLTLQTSGSIERHVEQRMNRPPSSNVSGEITCDLFQPAALTARGSGFGPPRAAETPSVDGEYLLLSRLQVITCLLAGDAAGAVFFVRRVAPSGENEERK